MGESTVPSISAVLPAWNEEANVEKAVRDVTAVLESLGGDFEVIVVDDGSRDRTGEVVKGLMPEFPRLRLVPHPVNRGYGGALRSGFTAATKELVFLTPADNQFDVQELHKLLPLIPEADIINPYRANRQDPAHRRLNAAAWNGLMRLLFGYVARDIDCGFKLFRRAVINRVTLTSNGAFLDTELLVGAKARGLRIVETPVTHLPRTAGSQTGAKLRVILKAFRELIRYWWRLRRELANERKQEQL
ncbi:MAG: glycosyltransferase family 2 protein [Chloroflexi bacterium]|nr:glycosyltransferase family 2 protein [Chloroflexota bacterium]